MSKSILYLVDGTSLCYRSFFAIKLSTSKGFPTGAVYGVYQTLKKIISNYKPLYMGVCFDVSRKTFRLEKFKEYKIQRPPLPQGLSIQIPLVKKLISYLGMKIIEKEGFEADDIIASFCKKALKDGISVVIVSSDKDLYQLIDTPNVSVYNYHRDKFLSREDFLKENGFSPSLITDYLSLTGDSIDNIPGARGIGKVGATKLIKEFGSIENIFNNLDKLPQKLQDILVENKKEIFLSKELVKLNPCDLELTWQDLKIGKPDWGEIYKIFKELEFKNFLEEFPTPSLDLNLEVKTEISKSFWEQLTKEQLFFSFAEGKIFIFDSHKNCIYRTEITNVKEVLQSCDIKKVSYGFKDQLSFLNGIDVKGLWFDVKIAAYLLDSSLADYNLSTLISHYLGEQIFKVPPTFSPYFIYRLYQVLSVKLKENNLDKLFFEVEMPLIYVLRKMQSDGVKIEKKVLDDLLKYIGKKIDNLQKQIFKIAGREFNLNSSKQLAEILFKEQKIKPLKKTKTGYSTNEEVLEKLSDQYPIAKFILEHRHLNKLATTYITPFIEEVEKSKGMLHTQFNQTATQTGRLSSSSPNLQSIPQKGEFSLWLRKAFISTFKGGYILSGDYSQIELRILAHLSGDKNLIEAFEQDLDIHQFTATLLFGIKASQVTPAQRNVAKRVNFSIIYGMSSYGLSKELKITPLEAQNFIDDYFNRYPQVKEYIDKIYAQAEKKGFVETILGRRRLLPEINSFNIQLKEFARRQAINAPIQGSCADLIKVAMIRIFNELDRRKLKAKLIIQIHDELIFDIPKEELEEVSILVKKLMEEAIKLRVPVKVNIKYGKNWGELCLF